MAIAASPMIFLPHFHHNVNTSSTGSKLIDASGEKFSMIFEVPKAGVIDKVGFRTGAVTTPQTLRVGLYTVDGSGNPTASAYGGMAVGTQTTPAATTSYLVTLATGATVVNVGDVIAATVEFDSAIGNLEIAHITENEPLLTLVPYCNHFTASWTPQRVRPILLIGYNDGSFAAVDQACWFNGSDSPTFNSGTGGADEYALRFQLPYPARIIGGYFSATVAAGADLEMILYSGTTAQRTKVIDGDQRYSSGFDYHSCHRFSSSFDAAANTVYRLGLRPTTANSLALNGFTVASAGHLDGLPFGQNFFRSKRLDQGAWTDETTTRPLMGIIVGGFDDASGGGGGGNVRHPSGLTGGFLG